MPREVSEAIHAKNREKQIEEFCDQFCYLPDGAFFAMAEEHGFEPHEFGEHYHDYMQNEDWADEDDVAPGMTDEELRSAKIFLSMVVLACALFFVLGAFIGAILW